MTLRIVTTAILIFSCYFIIGLQLAVVPGLVHWRLGFSPVIAAPFFKHNQRMGRIPGRIVALALEGAGLLLLTILFC
jgi:hypothetical protein